MARTRRNDKDAVLDAEIGRRVAALRAEHRWTLQVLAKHLELSSTYLNALEGGKHSFSAALVLRLSKIFGVPVSRLLGDDTSRNSLPDDWKAMFEVLPRRDQAVLLDLARKFTGWAKTFNLEATRKRRRGPGLLVSFEGIDGLLMHRLAFETKGALAGELPIDVVPYDHTSELWRHMRDRLGDSQKNVVERTLLFACECLQRQETSIRPMLREDRIVLTQFFAMASTVYRAVDGHSDRQLIDIIEAHLVSPDLVVVVHSSPAQAVKNATKGAPSSDQFYSPYSSEFEFEQALQMYRKTVSEFTSHEDTVLEIDLGDVDVDENPQCLVDHAKTITNRIRKLRQA